MPFTPSTPRPERPWPGGRWKFPNLPADAAGGTVKQRDYAASSLALAGGRLLFQQRMLELIASDADGSVDTYLMREETIAVDPQSAARCPGVRPMGAC